MDKDFKATFKPKTLFVRKEFYTMLKTTAAHQGKLVYVLLDEILSKYLVRRQEEVKQSIIESEV